MKLQLKLIVLFSLCAFIIIIVLGGILFLQIWNNRLKSIQLEVTNQLQQVNFALNSFFDEISNDVNNLAGNELIQTKDDSKFTNFLNAIEKTFIYNISEQEQKIIDILNNYRLTHPYINSVYMGRENGSFVRSHHREKPTKYDPRNRPWYILAKNNPGKVMKTDAYPSVTVNDVNIGIVKALLDKNSKVFGVIGVDVTLINLTNYIASFKTNPIGKIILIDNNEVILAGLTKDFLFKKLIDYSPDLLSQISKSKQGFSSVVINGEKNYVVFLSSEELNWKIAVLIPTKNIKKEILSQIFITILGLMIGLILLSFLTMLGMHKYVVSPIQKLIEETDLITKTSKMDRRINLQTHDEIGVLANSYNQMLDSINLLKNNLEVLVNRRTLSLQEANEKLSDEIKERIQTLNELVIAKERAESADKTKSAFLATMSHELRTPLNSIIGFTGIILQGIVGPLNEEQKKQLNMVRGSAQHLLALINDVLDISKIEAGQLKIVKERFNLRISLKKVIESSRPLAEKKGLSLLYSFVPEIDFMTGDQRRIEQIILNLISNAIKFTEKGSVTIECFLENNQVNFNIIDTGIGIKTEDMDKIFKEFHQIDSGLTRKYEGTGLGLTICKKLVEQMGGKIWVSSTWGSGSSFRFLLPKEEV